MPATPGPPGGGPAGDAPPYAWLDGGPGTGGPVGVGATLGVGALLAGLGLFGVLTGVLGGADARTARLVVGCGLLLGGGVLVRMGLARRAWRARHPGVDAQAAARAASPGVEGPWGGDSRRGRLGRWAVVVVGGALALVMALALLRVVTGRSAATAGEVVVIVLLGLTGLLTAGAAVTAVATGRRRDGGPNPR